MKTKLLTLACFAFLCVLPGTCVRAQSQILAPSAPDQIEINVHPGQELLTMIQILADKYRAPNPSKYATDFEAHFRQYADHEAIKQVQKFKGRVYTDLPELGWCISNFPEAELFLPEENSWYELYGKDTVQTYLKLALDFARESDFWQFYQDHQADYAAWAQQTRRAMDSLGYAKKLAAFYQIGNAGLEQPQFYVALDPLNSWGAHAVPHVGELNPAYAHYKAYSLGFWKRDGDEQTIPAFNGTDYLSDLVWHEGSHIYLDELLKQHAAEIEAISHLYNGDERSMKRQSISSWAYCFEENLVRGVVITLSKQYRSNRKYREQAADELLSGFIYAEDIAWWLEKYYLSEANTASLEALLPDMITWLGAKYDGVPK